MGKTLTTLRALAVTHVFPRWPEDPSAPFLLDWAQALVAAGHEVGVLAPHAPGLRGRHQVGGVPVRFVRYGPQRLERLAYHGEMHRRALEPTGPPLVAALLARMAAALRAEVRHGRPDVVHVHWWLPGAIVARLARLDVPTVVTVHGTDVGLVEARPRLRGLARWALAAADRIEAVSSDLAERLFAAVGVEAAAVNPMPLPQARLEPLEPDRQRSEPPVVLGVGRLIPEKGFADLIAAVGLLEGSVRVELAGDGPQAAALTAQAGAAGVDLLLRGRLGAADLRAAYGRADVVVQPSHREGFGLVAAEAAVLGVPVVATDSGGVRDILDPDALVAPGDVPALAKAIATALTERRPPSPEIAARLRQLLSSAASAARTADGWSAAVSSGRR